MPIKVRCPSCGDAFSTSSKNRGRRVECPICSASIRVSKRSKKRRRSGARQELDDAAMSDNAIAAVLADGDEPPREYVPSVLESDGLDASVLDGNVLDDNVPDDNVLDDSGPSEAAEVVSAVSVNGAGGDERGGPLDADGTLAESTETHRPVAATGGWRLKLPPFLAGVALGAVGAVGVMTQLGGENAPLPRPVAPPVSRSVAAPVSPAVSIQPTAPPADAGELAEVLKQVTVTSAGFEVGGGLLGGGRTLVLRIENASGLVLRGVTVDAELDVAAFEDAVLARELVPVRFSPVLGVGEQQEVRVAAPSGGSLAAARIEGPVRLVAKVVDLD
ncbi:MAG: hypothetical protein AAGG46_07405, partial [Planctomycetota bacterium]